MNPTEYASAALKTLGPQTTGEQRLHGAMGLVTESGEIADALKRHLYYGKDLDIENIIEECGDCMWYAAVLADSTAGLQFDYRTHMMPVEGIGALVRASGALSHYSSMMYFALSRGTCPRWTDYDQVILELGRILDYCNCLFETAAEQNIAKLTARYPKGTFDSDDATKRADKKITLNSIQCKRCGDVLVSTHVHDYKMCTCEKVGVDGGNDYLKRIGSPEDCIELSECEK